MATSRDFGKPGTQVDACMTRRNNRPVQVDCQTDLMAEIGHLTESIECAAKATETTLGAAPPDLQGPALADALELRRQLDALRHRTAQARAANEDPRAVRSELATLLCFAATLEDDARAWRRELEQKLAAYARERAAERAARERAARERRELLGRRDALQLTIVRTADRMAKEGSGECRRTVPVVVVGQGLSVCSVSVWCPRRAFHFPRHWLVTLNGARDDVLVRRQ